MLKKTPRTQPLFNYKLTIAYDGTSYKGWQIQPNADSIQEIIKNALKVILREDIRLIGAGRTDAGVHAHGQAAHFHSSEDIALRRLLASLNGLLPRDIRITQIEQVPIDFHAQYSAQGKIYHYHLWLDPVILPTKRFYAHHVIKKIDLKLLEQAATHFIGRKDFKAFANSASEGSAAKDAIRHLQRLDIIPQEGGVRLEFEGNGFLYKMVRNIVGTLLEVASGEIPIEDIQKIFEEKDRRKAGKTAPPHGLFLMQVIYDQKDR